MEATLTAKAGIAETFRAEAAPTSACNCHITSDRLLTRRLAIPLRKSAALINEIHPESSENSSLELIRYPRPFFKHINAPRELLHQINDSITKTCLNITSKRTAPHHCTTSKCHFPAPQRAETLHRLLRNTNNSITKTRLKRENWRTARCCQEPIFIVSILLKAPPHLASNDPCGL